MSNKNWLKRAVLLILLAFGSVMVLSELADARSGSGGRSFGGSGSSSKSGSFSGTQSRPATSPSMPPSSGMGGSSFMRGVAGGLVGGMLGSMLFGGMGHAAGAGGLGGSGIGFIELLILGGLGFFLYKKFIKPKMALKNPSPLNQFSGAGSSQQAGFMGQASAPAWETNPEVDAFQLIKQSEPDFDPERFKEIAQDVFFAVQAAWMRRDTSTVAGLLGEQLKSEYDAQFEVLKEKGHINRMENIAVRNIEIVDAGVEGQEVFIKVLFTANLLDYTVEEASGKVIKGDATQPVKFEEYWTFARPVSSKAWKLEGIQEK